MKLYGLGVATGFIAGAIGVFTYMFVDTILELLDAEQPL